MKKPEVGGPYRRVLRFEEAVDVDLAKKPKAAPIDRSGLVAVDSYELGYLRDSMDNLRQRELEMLLQDSIKRHVKEVAEAHGLSLPELTARMNRRHAERAQKFAAQQGGVGGRDAGPSQQELRLAPPSRIGMSQTIANPVRDLGTVTAVL